MKWEQFLEVCRRLNAAGVDYVVVGGFAIYLHGYERTTRDIDLMVDDNPTNVEKIRVALRDLLPEACEELAAQDVRHYTVVRMGGDAVVVDLMAKIAELDYEAIASRVEREIIDGVEICYADLDTMIAFKQGLRDKDREDLLFLQGKKAYLQQHPKK